MRYTLLFSSRARERFGSNSVISGDGREVEYTCAHKGDRWRKRYLWPDAEVVGFADAPLKITRFGIKRSELRT